MEIEMSRVVRYNVKRNGNTRTVIEVKDDVLSMANPNRDIFDVGSEGGGDDEDNMLSMIGDATQKHVDGLCVKDRLVWEHLIHMSDGTIRRREPEMRYHDNDEFNLRGEDLDAFFQNYPDIPQAMRPVYEEALQREQDRRDEQDIGSAEDIYNSNTGRLSFDEWEQNPQMMNEVDIPSTPRDLFIEAGNTRQAYFDFFPEDHPDAKYINQYLMMLNRDAEEFNDSFVKYLVKFTETNPMRTHTRKVLNKVSSYLTTTSNHEDLVIKALTVLDRHWGKQFRKAATEKLEATPMAKLIHHQEAGFENLKDKGINPVQQVKEFGSTLWNKYRRTMSAQHWSMYRNIKNRYQMQVFVRQVDVNAATLQQLREIFGEKVSRSVWCARPFQTAVELYVKGFVDRKVLTTSDTADKVLDVIIRTSEKKDLEKFNALAARLVAKQQGDLKLDQESWKNIWAFYRMTKNSLVKEVNKDGRGKDQELRTGPVRNQVNTNSGGRDSSRGTEGTS